MPEDDPRIAPPPIRAQPPEGEQRGFAMPKARIGAELVVIVGAFLLLAGLITLLAGRVAAGLLPFVPTSLDRRLGEVAFASLSSGGEACPSPEALRYVESVVEPLRATQGKSEFPFQILVADDSTPNAFALPGGFIVVNRGLIETAQDGAEVAGVLAHEMQHVVLRHATSRVLREASASLLFQVLFFGSGLGTPAQIYDSLSQSSFSRDQESAADREGARLLKRARIDPQALGRYLKRLSADAPDIPAWFSSHPDSPARAEAVRDIVLEGEPRTLPSPSLFRCHSGPDPK